MPYKSYKIKIAGTKYDRRIKLTSEQKEEIKRRYETENIGMRPLAKEYNVSRSTIMYIVRPEKLERDKKLWKIRKADGRYKPSKKKWAEIIKNYRKYKHKLFKEGKIDFPDNKNDN